MCCELKIEDRKIESTTRNQDGKLEIKLKTVTSESVDPMTETWVVTYPIKVSATETIETAAQSMGSEDIKLFVDSSEHINNRRERVNQFYWLVSTLILSGEFLVARCIWETPYSKRSLVCAIIIGLVSILGGKVCCLWKRTIENYGKISLAKIAILRGLEQFRKSNIFTCQGEILQKLDYKAQIKLETENADLLISVQRFIGVLSVVGFLGLLILILSKTS